MNTRETEAVLAKLSAAQWGIFTTRQATDRGVSRTELGRFDTAGRIERLAHGAYRQASAPPSTLDDLRAAFLLFKAGATAEERFSDSDIVVGSTTAAFLHKIGDLTPEPYVFVSADRRQTRRKGISFRRRRIEAQDIRLIEGLPTTSIERTIVDLLTDGQDESLVADVLRDASLSKTGVDEDRLVTLLDEVGPSRPGRDGRAHYDHLAKVAGIDELSSLITSLTNPAANQLLSEAFAVRMRFLLDAISKSDMTDDDTAATRALANITKALESCELSEMDSLFTPEFLRGLSKNARVDTQEKGTGDHSETD